MNKKLKKIILILFILILGYGIGFNINHYINLNRSITYNFNNDELKELRETKKELETRIDKINNLETTNFTDEELETIKSNFSLIIDYFDEMTFWNLEGKKKLNINDLYLLKQQIYDLPVLPLTSLVKIREKYVADNYEEFSNKLFVMFEVNSKNDFNNLEDSYTKNITLNFSQTENYLITYIEYASYLSKWVENYGGDTNA